MSDDWLKLIPNGLRLRLAQLLNTAHLDREDEARRILSERPWPVTLEEASDRCAAVIEYLLEEPQ